MGERAAVGLLFVLAIILIWGGFSGRMGLLLAALFAPDQVTLGSGGEGEGSNGG